MSVSLEAGLRARLREIDHADLVVGVPSFNNAGTIAHVVRAAAAGLRKYFPGQRAVIVNSDGGSTDGTPEVAAAADFTAPETILAKHPLAPVQKIVTPYHGLPGKGSAIRTICAVAERLRAQACAVVDADLRSITPEWIELLLGPVLTHDIDFVSPLYLRHKYDGTITNSIVYPLTRALYGREVRQPIGGDFGFSGRLASHYLGKKVWDTDVARFGIDIWMTTTALAEGFRLGQAFLGAKIHDAKDPGADLTSMLVQVVSSVFDLMGTYHERWRTVNGTQEVPLFGFPHGVGLDAVNVNLERMTSIFRQGTRDLAEVWSRILSPESLAEVSSLGATQGPPAFPDRLWVQLVYDFALAYHRPALPRDQIVRSLVPLYLGRTAFFVASTAASDSNEVEALVRGLADEFVTQKVSLSRRWP